MTGKGTVTAARKIRKSHAIDCKQWTRDSKKHFWLTDVGQKRMHMIRTISREKEPSVELFPWLLCKSTQHTQKEVSGKDSFEHPVNANPMLLRNERRSSPTQNCMWGTD
jgi:hypothetical protein